MSAGVGPLFQWAGLPLFFDGKSVMGATKLRLSESIAVAMNRLLVMLGVLLSLAAVALIPRGSIQSTGGMWWLLLLGGALTICCLVLVWLTTHRSPLTRRTSWFDQLGSARIVVIGSLLQIACAFALHPVQLSDSAAYLRLAHRMASGLSYQDVAGFMAFWPPGLPLYLTPFVWLFADDFVSILLGNLVLYVVTAFSLRSLSRSLYDDRVAVLALTLFIVWPSRIFLTTFASKENLTVALVTASIAIALKLDPRWNCCRNWILAALLGAMLGFAALAQPGLSLLFCALPFGLWYRLKPFDLSTMIRLLMVVATAYMLTLGPWIVRNYVVFHGNFIGVATNGGSVFYRANNDLSGAEFTDRGTIDISHLGELEQNTTGFRLGKEWIIAHPIEELRLASRKLAALLDNDSQGVYWAIQRGDGETHKKNEATEIRRWSGDFFNLLSYWYWMMLCAAVAFRCALALRKNLVELQPLTLLLMPFLYCAGIFSLFESGARQHIFVVPCLIVIAASLRMPGEVPSNKV